MILNSVAISGKDLLRILRRNGAWFRLVMNAPGTADRMDAAAEKIDPGHIQPSLDVLIRNTEKLDGSAVYDEIVVAAEAYIAASWYVASWPDGAVMAYDKATYSRADSEEEACREAENVFVTHDQLG